ncbi:hypothetical protein LSCM1_04788 [Leishmania martiniquensis]|uniref:Uncharacterized protein n=1 Tax=Leishmania martiniquensis TaxID=1580590 RepID=A0A836H4U2_9TRYP|nr:hypothetical protein LSCM1_04788 [Leishmania martiniquensis]
MPPSKEVADQSRKFGFKETREQFQQRKRQERDLKWKEKLSREDLSKLRLELESLSRARFLAPQQNERKRLVHRMIQDLEAISNKEPEKEAPLTASTLSPVDSDSDDDLFLARGTATSDEHRGLFVPRSIRRKQVEKKPEKKTPQEIAEEAEKKLLATLQDDHDLDSFLDSLQ